MHYFEKEFPHWRDTDIDKMMSCIAFKHRALVCNFIPTVFLPLLIHIQIFTANSDRDTIVYNYLSSPVTARFIRIHPWTYLNHISMRMEIYGC